MENSINLRVINHLQFKISWNTKPDPYKVKSNASFQKKIQRIQMILKFEARTRGCRALITTTCDCTLGLQGIFLYICFFPLKYNKRQNNIYLFSNIIIISHKKFITTCSKLARLAYGLNDYSGAML